MNALRLFPFVLIALAACQKDDEGDAMPSGGNGSGSVSVWTPEMQFTQNGQQSILSAADWTFASASTTQHYTSPDYCHALQEAVITNNDVPTEQWRIGFIGAFVNMNGVDPTPAQLGSMAYLNSYFYGRFLWNQTAGSYSVSEGVRIEYIDQNGVHWSTDRMSTPPSANFAVTEAVSTGNATGTLRQMKVTFKASLRNDNGDTFSVQDGAFTGPIVFL